MTNQKTEKQNDETQKNDKQEEETRNEETQNIETQNIEVHFPGSEVLRSRFPKSFQVVDSLATDWVKDGTFESLPLENPLAKEVAQKGLRKAKDFEKKVYESPVTEKIMMKALTLGMKAQALVAQFKRKK